MCSHNPANKLEVALTKLKLIPTGSNMQGVYALQFGVFSANATYVCLCR